jgi:putative peptidoglycan lipid II flippase
MSEAPRRSILSTTLLLLPVQIVFRAGEALLPLILAFWFGASTDTDVYQFAWAVFTFAGSLVFSAYQDSALVPILADVRAKDRALIPVVTGSLLLHTLVFGGALALAIGGGAMAWFGVRYAGAELHVALGLVVPFTLYLVALSVKTFFTAWLNAEHRYFAYPVASALGVVTMLVVVYLGKAHLGIVAVALGQMAGEILAALLLAGLARMAGLVPKLTFARPEPVRRFARLIAAEVGGGAVTRVNPVVDQLMAGLAAVIGGGTLLRLSNDVASVPTSLLQATLLPVLLSHLSDHFAGGRAANVRPIVRRALMAVIPILLAVSLLLYETRGPLLRLVYLHGKMDPASVERMIRIFPYHLVGLAPFGALLVLARAHVALKNSGIMLSMGALNAGLNAVFNVILLRFLGLEGIALSTSCVYLAVALVFWVRLQRKLATEEAAA